MNVQQVMTRELITCRKDDSLADAARKMWESDCGCLVVLDAQGALAGVLTDRDVCMCAFLEGARPGDVTVEHAMTTRVQCCKATDPLDRALELMNERQVRRLPVLDEQGRLCGLVSTNDLVRASDHLGTPAARNFVHALAEICSPRARPYACVVGASSREGLEECAEEGADTVLTLR